MKTVIDPTSPNSIRDFLAEAATDNAAAMARHNEQREAVTMNTALANYQGAVSEFGQKVDEFSTKVREMENALLADYKKLTELQQRQIARLHAAIVEALRCLDDNGPAAAHAVLAEAQAAHPDAEVMTEGTTYAPPSLNHLPDDEG